MESGGNRSGGAGDSGGGGDGVCSGGHLCHLCGYQYPNAHPSAKQRRAHRKNCANPPSPAAAGGGVVGELDGKKLLQDDGEAAARGGERDGASAADYGGASPGSAQEVGDVVDDDGNAERSAPKVGEVLQVVLSNKCTEDCLVSGDSIPSRNDIKASGTDNDEIQTEVVTQLSENVPHLEDEHPSQPAVSSDLCLDGNSLLAPQHSDGAKLSSEFTVDEINRSSVTSLETDAAEIKNSAQRNDIGNCLDDTALTESDADGIFDSSGKGRANEDNEDCFSCQQKLQTKIFEGQEILEEDPPINNSSVVSNEQILCEDTPCLEQSRIIFTNSEEHVSNSTIKEHSNVLGDKVPYMEKHLCTDDPNGNDLFQLDTGSSHSEAPGFVKPQQQADPASVVPDQLIIPKEMDVVEGLHCPGSDVDTQALSSAAGHAVGAEDITVGNHTKKVCSPQVTAEDGMQDDVRQTSDITFMPSQVDLTEVSTSSTCHETDMVSSKNGMDERSPNTNLTSHELNELHRIDVEDIQQNEVHGINVEEIQHNEDITAYTASQESNTVCGIRDFGENMLNEENIADTSSDKITTVQSTSSVEEKEQIEEFNGNPACNNINAISRRDSVEEKKLSEVYVETAHEINMASSLENVEEKERDKDIIADPSLEINVANLPSSLELSKHDVETSTDHTAYEIDTVNVTKDVEEKKQDEEITIDPTSHINMICSNANDEKKQNEKMTDGPSSDEIIVPHGEFNVDNKSEETMPDPICDKINVVSTTDSVEDKNQNGEVSSSTISHEDSVVCLHNTDNVEEKEKEDSVVCLHNTDNVEEKEKEEVTLNPTSYKLDVESNADNVEEKRQNEYMTADSGSHESNTLQITDRAEDKKQDTEVAADPAAAKIDVAQSTGDAEERKQEETVSTEGDDQTEEIADKEVIVNSDKNHVSLKALLSDKGVETKEKKPSTKDRVLSFRRRSSKGAASPVKPGSPKAVSGQQDWNSPARLPVEKKPKGKKQQWVPFICCPSLS
ncbi:hypothetical protein ABZP36_028765 [Zizania latifolia]